MDKIKILHMFVSVVETGGFASAAVALGVSPTTVSKAISRLESELGFKLFNRSTRTIKLTESGEIYWNTATEVLSLLNRCEQQLSQERDKPMGMLRLDVPVSYGRLYILPLLTDFKKRYPDINVDISFSDEYVNFIEKGIDVCIRTGQLQDSRIIAKQLSPIDFLTCASKEYLQANPFPIDEGNIDNHQWIRFRFKQTGRQMPILLGDEFVGSHLAPACPFSVDDGEALMELCAGGHGLVQVPHFIARKWLLNKSVEVALPCHQPKGFSVHAMYAYTESNYLPLRTRLFITFLEQHLQGIGESTYKTWATKIEPYSADQVTAPS